jgi:hypothetical protein
VTTLFKIITVIYRMKVHNNNYLFSFILVSVSWSLQERCFKSIIKSHILIPYPFRSPSLFYLLTVGVEVFCLSLDHTQTHTTVSRTPLDEGSACRTDLYLTTQTLTRDKHPITRRDSNHDPSKRSAADLCLRPRGHWGRLDPLCCSLYWCMLTKLMLYIPWENM